MPLKYNPTTVHVINDYNGYGAAECGFKVCFCEKVFAWTFIMERFQLAHRLEVDEDLITNDLLHESHLLSEDKPASHNTDSLRIVVQWLTAVWCHRQVAWWQSKTE